MKQLIFTILIVSFISSCALDKQFLKPSVLPPQLKGLTLNNSQVGDSLVLTFDENNLPKSKDFEESKAVDFIIEGHLIKSSSQNTLHAWQFIPKSGYNKHSILIFHGNSGSILNNVKNAIELSKRGFKVMVFDYSGFGFSSGKATRKNIFQDGVSVLDFLDSNTDRENEKIILYGQSLGGNLAVAVAAKNQEKIDGLVTEGAFSSHKDIASYQKGGLASLFVAEKYSAKASVKTIQKPILIIHSKDDKVVPFSMGKQLYDLANEPKKLLEIDGEHLAGLSSDTDKITNEILHLINSLKP